MLDIVYFLTRETNPNLVSYISINDGASEMIGPVSLLWCACMRDLCVVCVPYVQNFMRDVN